MMHQSYLMRILKTGSWALLTLLIVSLINFSMIRMAPVKPTDFWAGESAGLGQEVISYSDSDTSFFVQYLNYMGDIVQGKFGKSALYEKPVVKVLQEAITISVFLAGMSLLFCYVISFLSAWLYFVATPWVKRTLYGIAAVWQSIPKLVIALGLLLLFDGYASILNQTTSSLQFLQKFYLPVLTLLLVYWPKIFMYFVGMMTAEHHPAEEMFWLSRGYSKHQLFWQTISGVLARSLIWRLVNDFIFLVFTYGLVVEIIFGLPGMGFLGYRAIIAGDLNLFMAIFLLFSVLSIGLNLLMKVFVPNYEQVQA
jgi:peptide/nickel transport system permease protein